jgi:hypothetical protein
MTYKFNPTLICATLDFFFLYVGIKVLSFHSSGILSALKILLKRLVNHLTPTSSKVSFSGNHVNSFFYPTNGRIFCSGYFLRKFITLIPNQKKEKKEKCH